MLSGEKKEFIIYENSVKDFEKELKIIESFERNWILSEKDVRMLTPNYAEIFI